jgi:hypothetical protein
MNVLATQHPGLKLAGYSSPSGFWIVGNVPTETLADAVVEALHRLRAGEEHLAIHPNCGTNVVTSGILAGLAGGLAMAGSGRSIRRKLERLPVAILFATLAVLASRSFGPIMQQHMTTSGKPGNLQVTSVMRGIQRGVIAHKVTTRG